MGVLPYTILENLQKTFCFWELSFLIYKLEVSGRAQWLKPVIPALWEAEAGGSGAQEIETILVNMVKPHLY